MTTQGRKLHTYGVALAGAALWLGASGNAAAQSFTLEGCRSDGTPYVTPANPANPFICAAGDYTTGNLGKNWNELDNVPFRVTIRTGQQSAIGQVALVVDREDESRPGYDRISNATLMAGSDPNCKSTLLGEINQTPGIGGVSVSRYRLLKYEQGANLSCTYDFYARLALGSSRFPGASLHTNLARFNGSVISTSGIGAKEVSIPVNELTPPEGTASLSASAEAPVDWTLEKTADKALLDFGDVCSGETVRDREVKFTVTWKKVALAGGKVTVAASVSATNNAARSIDVLASGKIIALESPTTRPVMGTMLTLAPNSTTTVLDTTVEFTAAEAGGVGKLVRFEDIRLAFFEPGNSADALGVLPIPTATAVITKGSEANSIAIIDDTTSIAPTDPSLTFSSQQSPVVGQYQGYAAGNFVGGPIDWVSNDQPGSGSVTFTDVVRLNERRVLNGTLTNTARLGTSDGATASAAPVKVRLSSFARGSLSFTKKLSVPAGFLSPGQFVRVRFEITGGSSNYSAEREVIFQANEIGMTKTVAVIGNLEPDVYTVRELGATIEDSVGLKQAPLHDPFNSEKTVDLRLAEHGLATCSGSTAFDNMINPRYPTVKVEKTAFPVLESDNDNPWSFTLTGPGLAANGVTITDAANDGAGTDFGVPLTQPGTYTVTEVAQGGWDLTSVLPSAEGSAACTFTVSFPLDQGKVFGCSFTNTKRGGVKVIKTLNGAPLVGTSSFTFEVREGASTDSLGVMLASGTAKADNSSTVVFMKGGQSHFLIPGQTYQLCETGLPVGYSSSLSNGGFRPNSVNDPDGDNSTICTDFTASSGVTTVFEVDNVLEPPTVGDGDARTIGYWKNHNGCKRSKGAQASGDKTTVESALAGGSIMVGNLDLFAANCSTIVNLLDKRDTKGVKRASLPEFNLASQLTAALLNHKAGAGSCDDANAAKTNGQTLLVNAGFIGDALGTKLTAADAARANYLAGVLDDYNNNELCD